MVVYEGQKCSAGVEDAIYLGIRVAAPAAIVRLGVEKMSEALGE